MPPAHAELRAAPRGPRGRGPAREINAALDQRYEFVVHNRGPAPVSLALVAVGVRVAGSHHVVPLVVRELYLNGAMSARGAFVVAPGATRRLSVETHATQILNLPREPSTVVATFRAGTQTFHVEGQVSALDRCRDCR